MPLTKMHFTPRASLITIRTNTNLTAQRFAIHTITRSVSTKPSTPPPSTLRKPLPKKIPFCFPVRLALPAVPALLAKNSPRAIPPASAAAIRAPVSSVPSAAAVAIAAETIAAALTAAETVVEIAAVAAIVEVIVAATAVAVLADAPADVSNAAPAVEVVRVTTAAIKAVAAVHRAVRN
jgi:hypothetical protein